MKNEQNPKFQKPKLQTSNHLTTQQPNHLFGNQKSAIRNHKFCVRIPAVLRPHRLVDQDAALSRPKPEFESPWGHKNERLKIQSLVLF